METLGDYNIQKELGQGPFGSVYLAEHRFIKKTFALKILPSAICDDPVFLRRFEEQIGEIALLEHPHIVKIHTVSYSDGHYFIVTDPYVDSWGSSINLHRYLELKGKSLGEENWVQLLEQVATALDFAHGKNINHGGLKLSNVLVTPTETGVRVLLSDFGLTHLIGEKIVLQRIMSKLASNFQEREFMHHYAFLAPEQKEGETTAASDSYAFGMLAYYLLRQKIPEGRFDLPSRFLLSATKNWDYLIHYSLQMNPRERPEKLLWALQEYLHMPNDVLQDKVSLQDIAVTWENGNQMAFDLPEAVVEQPKPVLKPQEIARPEYEPNPGSIFQREMQVSHYTPNKVEIKEIEPLLTEMVVIPAGSYYRGSSEGARDEMPRHAVKLASFALDVHPVTNEQFVRFLQAMGGEKDHNNNDIIRLRDARIKRSAGKLQIESGYARHPVVGVTWYGALAYAKWIGKRLPTEAEWEAAATAGTDLLYPTGIDIERNLANYFSSDTTAVMSYPSNAFGLYDMAGNVYEWCMDWYAYNYYETSLTEPDNPKGPHQGVYRVVRGGCWKSLKEDLRSSHRNRNNPGAVNGTYGFRCAADVS